MRDADDREQPAHHLAGVGDGEMRHQLDDGDGAREQGEGGADPGEKGPLIGQREAVVGLVAVVLPGSRAGLGRLHRGHRHALSPWRSHVAHGRQIVQRP